MIEFTDQSPKQSLSSARHGRMIVEIKLRNWFFCRCLNWSVVSTGSVTCRDPSAPNWRRRYVWPRHRWKSGSRIDATRRSGSWCWLPSNNISSSSSISRWLRRWRALVVESPSKCCKRMTLGGSCTDHLHRQLRGTAMPPSPPPPQLPQTYSARYMRTRQLLPSPPILTVPSFPGRSLSLFQRCPDLRRPLVVSEYCISVPFELTIKVCYCRHRSRLH